MLRRIGAGLMAVVMAMALMLTPALAAEGTGSTLTITEAVEGAVYRVIPVLTLDVSPEDFEVEPDTYVYDVADGRFGTAIKNVIAPTDEEGNSVASEFAAELSDNTVTKNGFQIQEYSKPDGSKGERVLFRVKLGESEDLQTAYNAWCESNEGIVFMTKFADALKAEVEGTLSSGDLAETEGKKITADNTGTLTVSGLQNGYYLVISGVGQNVRIVSIYKDVTVAEKNAAPATPEKFVANWTTKTYDETVNDAKIGDDVDFRIVVEGKSGLNSLTVIDTLSEGLTFKSLNGVWFYPRLTTGALPEVGFNGKVVGQKGRNVYWDSMGGEDTSDGHYGYVSMITTAEAASLTTNKSVTAGVLLTASLDDTKGELTVAFTPEWLMSKRTSEEGVGSDELSNYTAGPMNPGDPRLEQNYPEDYAAGKHAMYNHYVGDTTTATDDGGLIIIEYTATVNENAVIGSTGNLNSVKLQYGNDPKEILESVPAETRTYVYEADVLKHALGEPSQALSGAKFTLSLAGTMENGEFVPWDIVSTDDGLGSPVFSADADTISVSNEIISGFGKPETADTISVVPVDNDSDGKVDWYRVATEAEKATATTELMSNDQGKIVVHGLDAGVYALTETEAPAGYILADEPVYFALGSVSVDSTMIKDNTVTAKTYVLTSKPSDPDDDYTFTKSGTPDGHDGSNWVTIENAAGLKMPETGGIGTTIFYIVGAGLVVCAGVLLVVKKRMGHADDSE